MPNTSVPYRIIVVGGGAGGLELVIRLAHSGEARRGELEVSLIEQCATHIWKPRLHEIAAGLLVAADEEVSYAALATQHGFTFLRGEMSHLDFYGKIATVDPVPYPEDFLGAADAASLLPERRLAFDDIVLAIGSTGNDFGTPGVAAHCYSLDGPDEAQQFHRAVLALASRIQAGVDTRMHIAIVGAGLTGVELAAELRHASKRFSEYDGLFAPDRLDITLVDMADRPLPAVGDSMSSYARSVLEEHKVTLCLGARVSEVTQGRLHLADGTIIEADLILWASGIKGREVAGRMPSLALDRSRRIHVDQYLRALGSDGRTHDHVYCIGDCAAFQAEGETSALAPTAQVAHQQAQLLAKSLIAQLCRKEALAFHYRYQGTLVSLGGSQGAGVVPTHLGSVELRGQMARLFYVSLYRRHLVELFGWWRVAALTLSAWLRRPTLPRIKLH